LNHVPRERKTKEKAGRRIVSRALSIFLSPINKRAQATITYKIRNANE
jgi:hypothetical protein